MPSIDLNNLVKPKQTNQKSVVLEKEYKDDKSVYTDLHLDIELSKSIGLGTNSVISNDIVVDDDIAAIKNSMRNIFSTRKGEKLLSPSFGSSLEQFLFMPINEVYARAIGDEILTCIQTFEPRVEVIKISVAANIDELQYEIKLFYRFLEIKKESVFDIIAKSGGEIFI